MLEKITQGLGNIVKNISGKSTITQKNIEDAVDQIKMALLEADVNLRVVRRFVNSTIEEALGQKVIQSVNPGQQFTKIIYDKIASLLGTQKKDLQLLGTDTQSVILLLGLNGAGKTTAASKLASKMKKNNRSPLLVACDLQRPAAIEQLKLLGKAIDVPVFAQEEEKDPTKVAKDAISYAKKNAIDTVILDTAGRMQVDTELMEQLVQMKKAVNPCETLLVLDAMTGQNAVDIAKTFDTQIDVSGFILTKFDSDARGGAALSLRSVTGKPIIFIGTGEKATDLEPFYPERIASRILGMGDVVSLVEKAQEVIDEKEALKLQQKMAKNDFTLDDMLEQMQQVTKMGSIQSLLEMMPGLSGQVNTEDIDMNALKVQEAIILSMTKKERKNHLIIGPSRRKRIAKGSGTSVALVNKLIKQYEKTKLTMKKIARNKGLQSRLAKQMGMTQ